MLSFQLLPEKNLTLVNSSKVKKQITLLNDAKHSKGKKQKVCKWDFDPKTKENTAKTFKKKKE